MGHGVGGPEEAAWQGVFPGSLLGVNSALDSVTSGPARHRAAAMREAGSTLMRLGSRRGPCPLICPHPSRLPKHAREAGGGAAEPLGGAVQPCSVTPATATPEAGVRAVPFTHRSGFAGELQNVTGRSCRISPSAATSARASSG